MLFTVKSEKLKLRLTEAVRDALGDEPARRQKPSACPSKCGLRSHQLKEPLVAVSGASGFSIDGSSGHSGCGVQTHFD